MKVVGKIYETKDYGLFKRLEGNRKISPARVKRLVISIKKYGYIMKPIIVNEKYEVIDGQHRLEALKELDLPVCLIISPGAGKEECIALNINQGNWTTDDYIAFYAENDIVSYKYLQTLMAEFGKDFKQKVYLYAATGKIENSTTALKTGNFELSLETYERAKKVLTWLKKFKPIYDKVGGHAEYYYIATIFCYFDSEVYNDRLLDKLQQRQANLIPVTTTQQALDQIEEIYNHRIRDKVYIKTHYKQFLDGKYKWYVSRYGNKY